jgi:anti-sigma-K factor RskA
MMEPKEYIESGILEQYVYGLLSETENDAVNAMANKYPEVKAEILSIEKAILNLSSSFAPFLSHERFEKIKAQLELKHGKVLTLNTGRSWTTYMGWVASLLLFLGLAYQYNELNQDQDQLLQFKQQNVKLQETVVSLDTKNQETTSLLNLVRDKNTTIVALAGQAIDPNSSAKVYWNQAKQAVYVDASDLPAPPKGMVYQVWALKLTPLTPTSIGLLDHLTASTTLLPVSNPASAEAFGITLEPAGGSVSPTLAKLYAMGKV